MRPQATWTDLETVNTADGKLSWTSLNTVEQSRQPNSEGCRETFTDILTDDEQPALEPKVKKYFCHFSSWEAHQVLCPISFLTNFIYIFKAHWGNVIVISGYINKTDLIQINTSESALWVDHILTHQEGLEWNCSLIQSINLAIKRKTCTQVQEDESTQWGQRTRSHLGKLTVLHRFNVSVCEAFL